MHKFNIRIYYEDTDHGGIVYYANYLKFAERARTEYLRDLGIVQSEIAEEHLVYFVVKKADIDYIFPLKLDNLVTVNTTIKKLSKASIVMSQQIIFKEKISCSIEVKIACIGVNRRPKAIPKPIMDVLIKSY